MSTSHTAAHGRTSPRTTPASRTSRRAASRASRRSGGARSRRPASARRASRAARQARGASPAPGRPTSTGPLTPDPYLRALSVHDADWLRSHMVRTLSRSLPGTRLCAPDAVRTPHGAVVSLRRPSLILASTPRETWEKAIEYHVSALLSCMGPDGAPRPLADYSEEEILSTVRLRLVPSTRELASEAGEPEIAPGIRLTHVLDLGGFLVTAPSEDLFARVEREQVEAAATRNSLQVLDRVRHSEPGGLGVHLIQSDTKLTAALALQLSETCERFGIPRPSAGHLVAVPEQECLLVVPVTGQQPDEALGGSGAAVPHPASQSARPWHSALTNILGSAVSFYEDAEHPLSPLCFHVSSQGVWTQVTEVRGGTLAVASTLPPQLVEALGTDALWQAGLAGQQLEDYLDTPSPAGGSQNDVLRAVFLERLADQVEALVSRQGEDAVTDAVIDDLLAAPLDVLVRRDGSQVMISSGDGTVVAPAPLEESVARIARLGGAGHRVLLRLYEDAAAYLATHPQDQEPSQDLGRTAGHGQQPGAPGPAGPTAPGPRIRRSRPGRGRRPGAAFGL